MLHPDVMLLIIDVLSTTMTVNRTIVAILTALAATAATGVPAA